MSWVIEVDPKGLAIPRERLRRFGFRVTNTRPVFVAIAKQLLRQNRERWDRSGYGWQPLAESTDDRKKREGTFARGKLRESRRLEKALTQWGALGQRLDIEPDELIFGLEHNGEAFYGRFHQYGKGLPTRVVQKATPATKRRVREALSDYLIGGARA